MDTNSTTFVLPDLSDFDTVLGDFAAKDIEFVLVKITQEIRNIRKIKGWSSGSLVSLKHFRAMLQPYLVKANRNILTKEEHTKTQELLNSFTKLHSI